MSPSSRTSAAPPALPPRVALALRLVAAQLGLLYLLRAVFYFWFRGSAGELDAGEVFGALWTGAKFDLRLVLVVSLPLLVLALVPALDPTRRVGARRAWLALYALIGTLLTLLHVVDLFHYDYLHERLNVSLLDNAVETDIAAQMVFESYPVGWTLLGLAVAAALWTWLLARLVLPPIGEPRAPVARRRARLAWGGLAVFTAAGIYGKASWYPLRWSDAYGNSTTFTTALALNPVLFFVDSLPDRGHPYDEALVRAHYAELADLLEVEHPDAATLDFRRHVPARAGLARDLDGEPLNLVVIHLESWSGFQTGVLGAALNPPNDLNPSPFFDEIAAQGLLFTDFFIPRSPTARSVFAMVTGLPDVNEPRTASRNPRIVDQHTLIAELDGYEKHYFLGGSAAWANIRGLLAHNVPGLVIHEEGDYDAPRGDVWGISDLVLFEEAARVLDAADGPVFAFLQTSGNHRPYTIPEDSRGFEVVEGLSEAQLLAGGFPSLEAYNGFRFMDHSLKHFFEVLKGTRLWGRTVFLMYGDHGVPAPHGIPWEGLQLCTANVPLLVYAPELVTTPQRYDFACSSVDLLPTALGLIGKAYDYQALGRDLLVPRSAERHFAFLYTGLLDDELCLKVLPDGSRRLYEYRLPGGAVREVTETRPEDLARLSRRKDALDAFCAWMLYHNGPLGPRE
ncbi:MAG: LTA synthase family protein [Planctomycetes bacterium]|nr:LTA synthase family protein [Planctomycetota bacterium]